MKLYYIYKITCLDAKVLDCYIGSTDNFKRRFLKHKSDCNNENSNSYNFKIYKIIRDNGGSNNFIMYPIDILESDDPIAVRKKETELIKLHNANLNSRNAYTDIKEYCKEYREANKTKIKEYYEVNKTKIKETNKIYREANRTKLLEKFNCECGGKYTNVNKTTHFKTKQHKAFLCEFI